MTSYELYMIDRRTEDIKMNQSKEVPIKGTSGYDSNQYIFVFRNIYDINGITQDTPFPVGI